MKKNRTELVILFTLSIGLAILLPNFLKKQFTIEIPGASDMVLWTILIFMLLSVVYFSAKPKDKEASIRISNGFHELYNESNQITKRGHFEGGKLFNGVINIYKKDGVFSHQQIIKEGLLIEHTAE